MKTGTRLASIVSNYFLACLLTLGSAEYRHRHEHGIQMRNYEHPWFGNSSIRFCAFNQYLDEHEGRCMIIPGGGTAISIDDDTTCEIEALRPHPAVPSSYYACRRTKTILAECRSGQRFENRLKRCAIDVQRTKADDFSEDAPEAYDHIDLPACFGPGRFPVPRGNCTLFYACTSNGFRLFRTIYQCPPSTGFDPSTKMCSAKFACDQDGKSSAEFATTPGFRTQGEEATTEGFFASSEDLETASTFTPSTLHRRSSTDEIIVGAHQFSTMSTTQKYANGQTTPSIDDDDDDDDDHETAFGSEEFSTSEAPFANPINSTEAISTPKSLTEDNKPFTTGPNDVTVDEKNKEDRVTWSASSASNVENSTVEATTTSIIDEDVTKKIEDFTTDEPAPKIVTTGKWLFDFSPTEHSTTLRVSGSPDSATEDLGTEPTLFTAAQLGASTKSGVTETPTISDEISLSQSETTVTLETTTVIPDSTVNYVTSTSTGETLLFDFSSTEESSLRLFTTTEAATISDETLLSQSETTVTSETTTVIPDSTVNYATLTSTGEKLIFDFSSTEESFMRLFTTTEAGLPSESSITEGPTIQDVVAATASLPGTESVSTSGRTISDYLVETTIVERETTDSSIPGSSVEKIITTPFTAAELGTSTEMSITEATTISAQTEATMISAETEATTISDEILPSQSETTVKSEPTTVVQDSAVNDETLTSAAENWSSDFTSTESFLILLTTTEATTVSDETLLSQSETTVKSEPTTVIRDSTVNDATSTRTAENLSIEFTSTESSPTLLTTTEADDAAQGDP